MKVLFVTQTSELGPASRYRVYQFLPALKAVGVDFDVSPAVHSAEYSSYFGGSQWTKLRYLPRIFSRRRRDWLRLDEFDVVFVQKGFFPVAWPRWKFSHPRMIYDFDDAVYGDATRRVLEACKLVLAGNEFLAEYARRFATRVSVLPTVVDTERFKPGPRMERPVQVGWIGSRTTVKYVEALADALAGSRVKVVGVRAPRLVCEFEPWNLEREVEQVQSFDIGLAPLANTEWERGKCGLKTLQYMACGIPVVGSPVGVQQEFIERSRAGLLAGTTTEWREKIDWLIDHPEERQAMGARGRTFVEANFSLRVWAPRWVEAIVAIARGE